LDRWFRVLGTGGGFVSFALGSAAISWVVVPWLALRHRRSPPRVRLAAYQRVMLRAYRAFLAVLSFYGVGRFERAPLEQRPEGAFVLVANHPCLLDVIAVLATVPDVCCVVRSGLFALPFLGPLLRGAGYIPGPGTEAEEGDTPNLDRVVERLREGHPVLIFPEGSRSPEWGLRRFRRGAVEAAARAEVPILPAFLVCSPSTLRKGQPWYDVPDRPFALTLDFLPVIAPPPGADGRELTQQLAAMYRERVDAAREASLAQGEGR
jgi:1-acyl-sn-glycerol-3-phosphate acyltransferase